MSLHQLFSILRARRVAAGLILLVTLALALAWVVVRPAAYKAVAPVLVDVRMDPVGGTALQGMVAPSYMATQIDIVKSERVAERVIQMLPADQPPIQRWREESLEKKAPQAWLAHKIQDYLDVKPARESNIVNIAWTGRTPAEAARVANAFAQAYLDVSLEVKTNPAKRYAEWFDDQVKTSRERLEQAQDKLSAFQQQSGLVSADERGDYETARLNDLATQLTTMQTRPRGGAASGEQSAVVATLRADVARLESKVSEGAATMGAAHPAMQRMQAELGALRSRMASESGRAGSLAQGAARSSKQREQELEKAITDQKAKVLGLTRQRGQLSVLQRDVESAQKAFETVSASAAQSRLQSMANQTNMVRITSAVEPTEKAGLRGVHTMMVAAVGGILLALAGVLLMELGNRRVRSVEDLALVTRLPILATVPTAGAALKPLRLGNAPRKLALAGSPA
jgi:succinoglycan biosynthesis transport protein ExoP